MLWVPFTYDEAYNLGHYVSRGPLYVLSHLPDSNNHILYSLLSCLFFPVAKSIEWTPLVRLANVLVTAAAAVAFLRLRPDAPTKSAVLAALFLFCSPLLLTYTFVGRGYLAGSLAVLATCVLFARGHRTAPLLAAISVYAVPTFSLHLIGIFAVRLATSWRTFIRDSAVFTVSCCVLFLPVLNSVKRVGQQYALNFSPNAEYQLRWLGRGVFFTEISLTHTLCAFALLVAFNELRHRRHTAVAWKCGSQLRHFYLLALAGIASFALASSLFPQMFIRNTIGVSALVWGVFLVGAVVDPSRWLRRLFALILVLQASIGAAVFWRTFITPGNPERLDAFIAVSPTPISKHWSILQSDVVALDCKEWASLACDWMLSSAPALQIDRNTASDSSDSCILGRVPVAEPRLRVYARLKNGSEGQVCF